MAFQSVLFPSRDRATEEITSEPAFFADLNLDQIVAAITAPKQEYNLKPLFYTPLRDGAAIAYRHAVLRDLENKQLFADFEAFAQAMRTMRAHLAQAHKLHHKHQRGRWLLDAIGVYCDAVRKLAADLAAGLAAGALQSPGLIGFCQYLQDYCGSSPFASLVAATARLKARLAAVRYCLLITGSTIKVRKFDSEIDHTGEVAATFAKFQRQPVRDYTATFSSSPSMNHVEAQILDAVALLFADEFSELDNYYAANSSYLDLGIARFDREIQFYVAYLDYMALFRRLGLKFCYPQVSATRQETRAYAVFDLALAYKLLGQDAPVVCNDFSLQVSERILVVTGPNQGGKTTFARALGQLYYLASLGCPTPGQQAELALCDGIFTHFEAEENITNLRGKLADDLLRIHRILGQATPHSLIIMNEIFSSTTLQDALLLGRKVMEAISELDVLCVCVTFLDELTTLSEKTVSMVSTVDPHDPATRTYKVVRRPADGRAYAVSLAEKYRLTYDSLMERLQL